MLILSFDVGIINLAYCLFTKNNDKWSIIEWDIINLTDRESSKCACGLKASFIHNNIHYCKVHSKKCETIKPFEELFCQSIDLSNKCNSLVKENQCGKKSSYQYNNHFYCKTHATSEYKKMVNLYKVKPFKNKPVASMDFDDTRLKLLQKLDSMKTLLNADVVLIENQPSLKNPVMKSIANALYDFFLFRGIIDKTITNSNITKVKFMSPSNKLKLVDENETKKIVVMKGTDESKAYKLTKELSVKYTKEIIQHLPEWLTHLNTYKKKDDLCDAFLQGCYYYEKLN